MVSLAAWLANATAILSWTFVVLALVLCQGRLIFNQYKKSLIDKQWSCCFDKHSFHPHKNHRPPVVQHQLQLATCSLQCQKWAPSPTGGHHTIWPLHPLELLDSSCTVQGSGRAQQLVLGLNLLSTELVLSHQCQTWPAVPPPELPQGTSREPPGNKTPEWHLIHSRHPSH